MFLQKIANHRKKNPVTKKYLIFDLNSQVHRQELTSLCICMVKQFTLPMKQFPVFDMFYFVNIFLSDVHPIGSVTKYFATCALRKNL